MADEYQFGFVAGTIGATFYVGPFENRSDGTRRTGLTVADITGFYVRGTTQTDITKTDITFNALAALNSAHTSGGWYEIGSGWYRFDAPKPMLDSGMYSVLLVIEDSAGNSYGFDEVYPISSGVWALTPRTLTITAAEIIAAISGSDITVSRHVYWAASLTGLGAITGWDRLWFTLKARKSDADSAAIVQVLLSSPGGGSDGLVYLEGAAAATPSDGGITVDDASAGDITVWLLADATGFLSVRSGCYYDVKWRDSAGKVHQLTEANATIRNVVTRATS